MTSGPPKASSDLTEKITEAFCEEAAEAKDILAIWESSGEATVMETKHFIRRFPRVTALLREGEMEDFHSVVADFAYICYADRPKEMNTAISLSLADCVIPGASNAQEEAKRERFRYKFALAVYFHCKQIGVLLEKSYSETCSDSVNLRAFQLSFKKTVAKYQKAIIVEYYNGCSDVFRKDLAYLLKASPQKFCSFLLKHMKSSLRMIWFNRRVNMANDFMAILPLVQSRLDDATLRCWECKEYKEEDEILACSGCEVARYCGRACQKRSWENGHKQSCGAIKLLHEKFTKEKYFAKDENKHPVAHVQRYGVEPAYLHDCIVASRLCYIPAQKTFGEATMENFYKNVAEVQKGKLWVHKNFVRNAPVRSKTLASISIHWSKQFYAICHCLAYDYNPGELRQFVNLDEKEVLQLKMAEWTWNIMKYETLDENDRKGIEDDPMAPEDFLGYYATRPRLYTRRTSRLCATEAAFRHFQEYHKHSIPSEPGNALQAYFSRYLASAISEGAVEEAVDVDTTDGSAV